MPADVIYDYFQRSLQDNDFLTAFRRNIAIFWFMPSLPGPAGCAYHTAPAFTLGWLLGPTSCLQHGACFHFWLVCIQNPIYELNKVTQLGSHWRVTKGQPGVHYIRSRSKNSDSGQDTYEPRLLQLRWSAMWRWVLTEYLENSRHAFAIVQSVSLLDEVNTSRISKAKASTESHEVNKRQHRPKVSRETIPGISRLSVHIPSTLSSRISIFFVLVMYCICLGWWWFLLFSVPSGLKSPFLCNLSRNCPNLPTSKSLWMHTL